MKSERTEEGERGEKRTKKDRKGERRSRTLRRMHPSARLSHVGVDMTSMYSPYANPVMLTSPYTITAPGPLSLFVCKMNGEVCIEYIQKKQK